MTMPAPEAACRDDHGSLSSPSCAVASEYVAAVIAGQMFGIPIDQVHDVFIPAAITRVPLADPDVAGILNLRGRIVTAIDMRQRLALEPQKLGYRLLAIGIERQGESFGLLIDSIGEVLHLDDGEREPNPTNLDPRWAAVSRGVFRLHKRLLVVLDVQKVIGAEGDGSRRI